MKISTLSALIQEEFSQQLGIVAIVLFGSQMTGKAKPDSDIDLAVLYDHDFIPTPMELWEKKELLSEKLHSPIDLVCLNSADTIIASQILKTIPYC